MSNEMNTNEKRGAVAKAWVLNVVAVLSLALGAAVALLLTGQY